LKAHWESDTPDKNAKKAAPPNAALPLIFFCGPAGLAENRRNP
jgi:hypothetical protein